jgi:hypothetical protein
MASFKGANQYTIEITIGTNVKVSHHRGHVLIYLVKNKMPFIHHIIKWWGCNYTVEDEESQDGRT